MSLRPGDLDRAWAKLGFKIDEKRADIKAYLWVDGKLVLSTYRSHGSGKLDGKIPYFIRNQMKLNEAQFKDAIDCPLKKDAYLAILREKGLIPNNPSKTQES